MGLISIIVGVGILIDSFNYENSGDVLLLCSMGALFIVAGLADWS